ncbi:MAG: hypothetical protein VX112_04675 [Pseudomonadota bacterium]|nr:hypothetical protein [Pseudomonadota bacterium]
MTSTNNLDNFEVLTGSSSNQLFSNDLMGKVLLDNPNFNAVLQDAYKDFASNPSLNSSFSSNEQGGSGLLEHNDSRVDAYKNPFALYYLLRLCATYKLTLAELSDQSISALKQPHQEALDRQERISSRMIYDYRTTDELNEIAELTKTIDTENSWIRAIVDDPDSQDAAIHCHNYVKDYFDQRVTETLLREYKAFIKKQSATTNKSGSYLASFRRSLRQTSTLVSEDKLQALRSRFENGCNALGETNPLEGNGLSKKQLSEFTAHILGKSSQIIDESFKNALSADSEKIEKFYASYDGDQQSFSAITSYITDTITNMPMWLKRYDGVKSSDLSFLTKEYAWADNTEVMQSILSIKNNNRNKTDDLMASLNTKVGHLNVPRYTTTDRLSNDNRNRPRCD